MPFSDGDIRASHTIRIFGTNEDEDILHDIWIDIERIDVYRISTKIDGVWRGVYRRLYWNDDYEDSSGNWQTPGEGNPARSEGTLKICSPDEFDQEKPEEWVPVKTIIQMEWKKALDQGMNVRRGNRTSADNQNRAVAARRVFHRETIIDEKVESVLEERPKLKAYIVSSNQYNWLNEENEKETENYIEVQYVSHTWDKSNRKPGDNKDQDVLTILKNIHYLKITEPAKGPANEEHGFNPPWALDPFQAIVNVNWGGLAVEFGSKDQPPEELKE